METFLRAEGLTRTFPGFALQDLDLRLQAGSILGLIGPNGAGKTTFMKLATGQLLPEAGLLEVCGLATDRDLVQIRNLVGYVPDEPPFLPGKTVHEILQMAATWFLPWDQTRILDLLDGFSIPTDVRVKSLSRGRKTMLAMALALAHDPRLLLLDEPFAGLDASGRRMVLSLMNEFVAGGDKSVLIATHQTEGLASLADRIVFLDRGRIVLASPLDDLLTSWKWLNYSPGALPPELESKLRDRQQGAYGCRGLIASYPEIQGELESVVSAGEVKVSSSTIDDILISLTEGN